MGTGPSYLKAGLDKNNKMSSSSRSSQSGPSSLKAGLDKNNKMSPGGRSSQINGNLDSQVREITKIFRPLKSFGSYKHSGLLVEAIEQIDGKSIKQSYIMEYMEDHQVQVTKVNEFRQENEIFYANDYKWTKDDLITNSALEKKSVDQIRQLMVEQANKYGKYDLWKNNCNIVADNVVNRIREGNI